MWVPRHKPQYGRRQKYHTTLVLEQAVALNRPFKLSDLEVWSRMAAAEALSSLWQHGYLTRDKDGLYMITEEGKRENDCKQRALVEGESARYRGTHHNVGAARARR